MALKPRDPSWLKRLLDYPKEPTCAIEDPSLTGAGQSIYAEAVHTPLTQCFGHTIDPSIADARLIVGDSQKLLEKVSDEQKIVALAVRDALAEWEREVFILTPCFIPRKSGIGMSRSCQIQPAESVHQNIGKLREVQPQLVGAHRRRAGAISNQS